MHKPAGWSSGHLAWNGSCHTNKLPSLPNQALFRWQIGKAPNQHQCLNPAQLLFGKMSVSSGQKGAGDL